MEKRHFINWPLVVCVFLALLCLIGVLTYVYFSYKNPLASAIGAATTVIFIGFLFYSLKLAYNGYTPFTTRKIMTFILTAVFLFALYELGYQAILSILPWAGLVLLFIVCAGLYFWWPWYQDHKESERKSYFVR